MKNLYINSNKNMHRLKNEIYINSNKIDRYVKKICMYYNKKHIDNIILDTELMNNSYVINLLKEKNLNVLEGILVKKYTIKKIIFKLCKQTNIQMETTEIIFIIDQTDELINKTISEIAKISRKCSIVTKNYKQFQNLIEYLYNEYGIMINVTSDVKPNNMSQILINIDYTEQMLNRIKIPNNIVIINVPNRISYISNSFRGTNITSWEVEIPREYQKKFYNNNCIYEAMILSKPIDYVFKQMLYDKIQIREIENNTKKIKKICFSIDKRRFVE